MIHIKKRNGRLELFNPEKINKVAERACLGLQNVSASELVIDAHLSLYDKVTTTELDTALILTARQKVVKDPNWSKVAARILLSCIYKEVFKERVDFDTFAEDYRGSFIKTVKNAVKEGRFDKRMLGFDLKKLAAALQPSRDDIFEYVGIQNVYDRYLYRMGDKVVETPQAFYMRVAMGISFEESDPTSKAIELYEVYSQHLASPSTPTLFNSGTINNQLSSCFLSMIDDSVDGIFDGLWQEARKSKHAGGLGFHVSNIRGSGAFIVGTNGKSSGLIPWLKVYNDMLVACDQAGKRAGSGCAYLAAWHVDVEDFIDLRQPTGEERRRCHDMNTALWINDLFIKRVEEDGEWTLFCPSYASHLSELYGESFEKAYFKLEEKRDTLPLTRVVKAKDLWKKILKSLFSTSHPWPTFADNANIRYSNIHAGTLHGSNLCTEIFLHTKAPKYKDGEKIQLGETAVCNLASLCLPSFFQDGSLNTNLLRETIVKVIRGLDNVVSLGFFPTKEAKLGNETHRAIGMGTMGWANVYAMLGIAQDSDEAIVFADTLMEQISYYAIEADCELAKERGVYPSYDGSKWSQGIFPIDTWQELAAFKNGSNLEHPALASKGNLDWDALREKVKQYGMRNSNVMAVAPNASIAYQLGCEQSHEPFFSMVFRYENKSGNYYIINRNFIQDMKKEGLWSESFAQALESADGDVALLDIPTKYKEIYKTAFARDQIMLVKACAARQKWIDQGLSFNLYNDKTSLKYLNDIYIAANKYGLKSTYYLRNQAATQIQKTSEASSESEPTTEEKQATIVRFQAAKAAAMSGESCEMCQG